MRQISALIELHELCEKINEETVKLTKIQNKTNEMKKSIEELQRQGNPTLLVCCRNYCFSK